MAGDWSISYRERRGNLIHLQSKNKFWILRLQLLYVTHNSSGDEYTYWVKVYQPDSKFEISGPRINGSSESEIIHETSLWGSRTIPKLERVIFLSDKKIAKLARENLKHEILQGSEDSRALQFVKYFINLLVERMNFADSDKDEEQAKIDLDTTLSKDSVYRLALDSEDLQVHMDWMESMGLIKSNPRSASKINNVKLISKCQSLWTEYYNRPTKRNLKFVFQHLDRMKLSKSEKIKKERLRCLKAANREAKRIKYL